MPELRAQTSCLAIGAQQRRNAIAAAASVRVGLAPEGRHLREGRSASFPQRLGRAGVADGALQPREQHGAFGLIGRPAAGAVAVVGRRKLLHQIARCFQLNRALRRRRGAPLAVQFCPCALGPCAVTQPAHRLQVRQVVAQQTRLQMPGLRQLADREAHHSRWACTPLQVAIEAGDAQGSAGLAGSAAPPLELQQGLVGLLDRLRSNAEKLHTGSGGPAPVVTAEAMGTARLPCGAPWTPAAGVLFFFFFFSL